jgi:filamentous hemagglutinin
MLPDAAANEVGGLFFSKIASAALGWAEKVAPRVTYLSPDEAWQVITTPKGMRPDPSTYLPESMIDAHAALFEGGVARIQPNMPTSTIGRTETWVLPKAVADEAIRQAGGDVGKLEQLLGMDKGYLGTNPVRVDIPKPVNLRMSSGNEYGANPLWTPGGYTSGGLPEAVINPVPPGAYKAVPIR